MQLAKRIFIAFGLKYNVCVQSHIYAMCVYVKYFLFSYMRAEIILVENMFIIIIGCGQARSAAYACITNELNMQKNYVNLSATVPTHKIMRAHFVKEKQFIYYYKAKRIYFNIVQK